MRYRVNARSIEADVWGEGPALLAVHGLGGTANFWAPIVAEFSANMTIIAPDLPCAARSDIDPDVSVSSLVADLLALLDELGIGKAHVAGHSMGSIVCQHLVASAPERVVDLVLLGAFAEPPEPARPALRARAELARSAGMGPIAETICDRGLSPETKRERPVVTGFVREMMLRQDPEGYALSCLALAEVTRAPAARIACRTLLISGTDDTTAPPAAVESLRDSLPDARSLILSGCGHWTAVEKPAEVCAAMRAFYQQ